MKKTLFLLAVIILFSFGSVANALSTYITVQGGTGTSTPSGILYGDNGATGHLNTTTIGTGLSFSGGVLSSTGTTYTGTYPINVIGSVISTAFASSTLSASSPLTGSFAQVGTGGTLGIQVANTSQGGYLTNTDWNTFNGKGTGTVTSVSGSGGTTGLTLTGGAITTSGTLTLGGTLAVANGGTGLTSGYNNTNWDTAYGWGNYATAFNNLFDVRLTATTTLPALTTLANLTTVGTIGTGVWHGTAIADSYISSATTWNAKLSAAITGLTQTYGSTQTGATQTFATSSDTNINLTITNPSANNFTFTPVWAGTLADARIASAATWNAKQSALGSLTGIIMGNAGSFYGTATSSAISMSITGNAGTVTNGVYTTGAGTVYENPLTFNYPLTRSVNAISFPATSTLYSNLSGLLKSNGTSAMTVGANGTDYTLLTAASCTNQVITALTAAGGSTCSSVSNAMLSNSTIGLTSSGSITVGTSPISLGGTSALNLNMGNANTWTGLQSFANSTSTLFSSSYASSTSAYFGTAYLPSLGTSAGSFLAVNASGQVIATSTPTAGTGTVLSGTTGQFPYYAGAGTTLTATSSIFMTAAGNVQIGYGGGTVGATLLDVNGVINAGNINITTYTALTRSGANHDLVINGTGAGTNSNTIFNSNLSGTSYERMRIDQNGNVGIGTTTPGAKLEVYSAGYSYKGKFGSEAAAVGILPDTVLFGNSGITGYGGVGYIDASQIGFKISNSEKVRIDTNGNVGIGTTGPASTLDVQSAANVSGANVAQIRAYATASSPYGAAIRIDSTAITGGHNWMMFSSGGSAGQGQGKFIIQDTSVSVSDRLTIDSTGNVGIGTTTPGSKLTILGHIGTDGLAPTVSSCGTSPATTLGSTDTAGTITQGTISTGCTITFASAYARAPFCTVADQAGLVFSYAVSASAITVTNIGALSSTAMTYTCFSNDL